MIIDGIALRFVQGMGVGTCSRVPEGLQVVWIVPFLGPSHASEYFLCQYEHPRHACP